MPALMKVRKVVEKEVPGLGARIKKARESDRRSLVKICNEIKMTPANWYRIEREEAKYIPIETLRLMEKVLGVDLGVNIGDCNNE